MRNFRQELRPAVLDRSGPKDNQLGIKKLRYYYFHVTSVSEAYLDRDGILCINAESAKSHAYLIASELARLLSDKLGEDERSNLDPLSVQVMDENGNEIIRMPIIIGRCGLH